MQSSFRSLRDRRQRTVLRLQVSGRWFVYSDDTLAFTDSSAPSALPVVTRPGLVEPDLSDALGSDGAEVSIDLLDPEGHAALIAGIETAWAELYQIGEGEDWTTRRLLLRGWADAPTYGHEAEPIRFGLASAPWEDRGLVPLPTWRVSATTWPRAGSALVCPEDLYGPYYPVVLGAPGQDAGLGTGLEEADWYPIPALLVEIDDTLDPPANTTTDCTVLLGYGRLACVGGEIELYSETLRTHATLTPYATTDAAGTPVTCVTVSQADLPITLGDPLFWRPTQASPAGIPGTETAGGAIRWLLGYSSVGFDPAALGDAVDRLGRWRVDLLLNEPLAPYSFVQDQLLSILPVELIETGWGAAWCVLPVEPAEAQAVAQIDVAAEGGYRSGPVEVSSWREISTEILIEYAPDTRTGAYRRTLSLSSAAAQARFPGPRILTIQADAICDPGTALALGGYHLARASQLVREVEVVLPPVFQTLSPGDLVTLTISDVGWSRVLCVVLSVPRISGLGVFRFRSVPSPDRSCA